MTISIKENLHSPILDQDQIQMQNSTSSSIYNWNSLHQKHIFNTILYKFSKTKIVLNCNSCWQLVAQAGNGTEAHMNIAHAHRTAQMAADGAHPFLECTVHRTPETPCASCCLIVSRWLLMSSRAMLLLVLIAHSGRCVWNKYAGHPPKWKRFPSWVAPGLLWSIQHCNISLGQDPIWQIIVLQGLCSEHTCIEPHWNATCWDIQAVLLLFAVPDGADYDSLTINCGKCH